MQESFQPPEYAAVCHIRAAPAVERRTAPFKALYLCRGAGVAAPVAVFRTDRVEDLAA
jgi:hypothetical protein